MSRGDGEDSAPRAPGPGGTLPAALASDAANMRFARHRQLLARWPVSPEGWARAVEEQRLAAADTTPGPATFGR
jgi:hypothetical protein